MESQRRKADALRSLHARGDLLILPNVWNPIGARILQAKGYPAVATASAAISASMGYEDGEKINRSTLIDLLGRIARSVDVPVTADIEAGYGESILELEETVRQVIECGVAGVNIEDSLEEGCPLRPVEEQCRRISAVRRVAEDQGLHLVVNARVDSYLSSSFPNHEDATEEAVRRAKAYSEAGADCIYPIGPGDEETVRALRNRIESPINILATPGAASLSFMRKVGVNRVSFGPFVFRSCLKRFADIAADLKNLEDCSFFNDMLSSAETGEYLIAGHEAEKESG
ncbi:MAG: isocitrate lyase/phosphoenolpyruvate mutase family protein [Acidobacteria bacterium]|nr:isocitrate lyase/phosphoenolpyruvate mutase family protein [Acidobacteriota bacterium]